jgi:2-phosphosulfolactate phosphatase
MQLDVALLPALLPEPATSVCIVVDVLRASSSCVTLLDSGAASIAVAATVDEAQRLRNGMMPDALLCGETGGLPPDGFDYGNSPVEFAALDLSGRRVVMATSNGTRALARVASAPAVFVGSLLNRAAICDAALAAAQVAGAGITVVCSGNDYGRSASLEDTLGAGALIAGLEGRIISAGGPGGLDLTDAGLMAARLFGFYSEDLVAGLKVGSHGRSLARLGFHADLDFCARLDHSRAVPRLRHQAGVMVLSRVSSADGGC